MTEMNDYIEISGRKFTLYRSLLARAEAEGIRSLDVDILQLPSTDNNDTISCKATIEMESGKRASDIGEANADTLDEQVKSFLFSMASTRAKSRCIRNVLGEGYTALEECRSIDDIKTDSSASKPQEDEQKDSAKERPSKVVKLITAAQKRAIISMSERKKLSVDLLTKERYGVSNIDELNRSDASNLISHLKEAA